MGSVLQQLDETIISILGQWDIYTTILAVTIVSALTYKIVTRRDADVHPMLLARQAQASAVRNPGESAVYRSHSTPHGMPLNSGLNVKDPGASKWSRGRDGDLRDIWRAAVNGPVDDQEGKTRGSIFTVLGSERVIEHNLDDITVQINTIGQYVQKNGGSRVAIDLPNSVELLAAIFACAFYGLTPIILPYSQVPNPSLYKLLDALEIDTLIAAAGSVSSIRESTSLKNFIGVVDRGNEHMSWEENAEEGDELKSSTWQKIVSDGASSSSKQLPQVANDVPKDLITFWGESSVTFSHANLVAAISGQLSAFPASQRITNADLFFPADPLSKVYPLVLTLAALYFNASIALNSVSGENIDIELATKGISPTIIVASKSSLLKLHERSTDKMSSQLNKLVHRLQSQALTKAGVMPVASMLASLNDSLRPSIGTAPGKLRLIFTADEAGGKQHPINTTILNDLRVFTGARIVYALTAAKAAGAITQTNLYDYRVGSKLSDSHFGAPVTSVEVMLRDTKDHKTTDDLALGEIIVRGPAVVHGEAALGVIGTMRDDACLTYPAHK